MIAVGLMSTVAATLPGCGELVTGANLTPTVKYKPSTAGAADTGSATATGATPEAATSEGAGTVRGKVELDGAFTTLQPLHVKGAEIKDAAVCAAVTAPDEKILVKDGGLANVFIYLKKAPKVVSKAPDGDVILRSEELPFQAACDGNTRRADAQDP